MKKPTLKEFTEQVREDERLEGAKLTQGHGLPDAIPFTDEEILKMWQDIQSEPKTGVNYHGEITSLT